MATRVVQASKGNLKGLAKRVTVIRANPNGEVERSVVYREKGRSDGRGTGRARGLEKPLLKATGRLRKFTASFEKLHRRSNRKKKNGGMRDLMANILSAQGRALR